MTARSILRPEHIAPVRNVSLRARQIVEGMIAGFHKSPYHGFTPNFWSIARISRVRLPGHRLAALCENRPFLCSSL